MLANVKDNTIKIEKLINKVKLKILTRINSWNFQILKIRFKQ